MLREAGAREVHVRISSPPVKWPCFYGIDFATRAELVANGLTVDEIRTSIGADSLGYVSLEGLVESTGIAMDRLCRACFDGVYPIDLPEPELLGKHLLEGLEGFESRLLERRRRAHDRHRRPAHAARRWGRGRGVDPPVTDRLEPQHPATPPLEGSVVRRTAPATYAAAGVDVEAGEHAVALMKASIARAQRPEVVGDFGGFAGLFDVSVIKRFNRPLLATSTDGVGTKVVVAQKMDKHDTIGIDLVAMVVDDLVVCGAEPLFMTDYIATGKVVPERIAAIVAGIAEGCRQAGCALVGGETAEHPGLLSPDEYDVAGAGTGVVDADDLLGPERVRVGDVAIAMRASGLHSNGYSLARHVLLTTSGLRLDTKPEVLGRTLGEELLEPTRIYSLDCLDLARAADVDVHAFAHVTGGGLAANLARVLPPDVHVVIDRGSWTPHPVFSLDRRHGPGVAARAREDVQHGRGDDRPRGARVGRHRARPAARPRRRLLDPRRGAAARRRRDRRRAGQGRQRRRRHPHRHPRPLTPALLELLPETPVSAVPFRGYRVLLAHPWVYASGLAVLRRAGVTSRSRPQEVDAVPRYRRDLPQLSGELMLSDSGLETDLIFNRGIDLPGFAAFPLLDEDAGRAVLATYYLEHLDIAQRHGTGFVLETPTWRSTPDWGRALGYSQADLDRLDRAAVELVSFLRDSTGDVATAMPISGLLGPRGDGYAVSSAMTAEQARAYHSHQVETFAGTDADLVSVLTLSYAAEGAGVALAARDADMPVVVSFTVETDGTLPDGSALGDAIRTVDDATDGYVAYFAVNCAHPDHIARAVEPDAGWVGRVGAVRANASRKSHAELDEATSSTTAIRSSWRRTTPGCARRCRTRRCSAAAAAPTYAMSPPWLTNSPPSDRALELLPETPVLGTRNRGFGQ